MKPQGLGFYSSLRLSGLQLLFVARSFSYDRMTASNPSGSLSQVNKLWLLQQAESTSSGAPCVLEEERWSDTGGGHRSRLANIGWL